MKQRRERLFEELVTSVFKLLGTDASVEHDQMIVDRLGHERQFDVALRGHFAGSRMLGVIECKVDVGVVEAFFVKAQEVTANFRILCSRDGFTWLALEKAQHHAVQPVSLISERPGDSGVLTGTGW